MNKSLEIKIGSLLSYAQMFAGIVLGLVYTPFMLRILGQSEYGLYKTVSSTISMLSILSLGFNSSYIRYYSKYKRLNDDESIGKLNGLYMTVFLVIGGIALLCGLYLSNHLYQVFASGLTKSEYRIARILVLIMTVNLSLSFPATVFQNIISAHERFVFLKLLGVIKTVIGPLATFPLLLMGYGAIGMVIVTVSFNIFVDCVYAVYVFRKLNNRFVFRDWESGLFRSVLVYTSFIAINVIVDQINWNMDSILLGRFRGTVGVAIYSVGFTLNQYYRTFSTSISGVFTPRIHFIVEKNKDDLSERDRELTNLFVKVGRIQYLILSFACTGLIIFGKEFISYWAGSGYEDSYYVALLLVIPVTIPMIQNLGIEIQRAENNHKFRSVVYAIMAGLNLLVSIVLCQLFGAVGAATGTAISLIVANGIIMNIYYHKKCGINILLFWQKIICMSVGIVIPIMIGIGLNHFINAKSIYTLFVRIILYSLVFFVSMWIIGMNEYERELIIKPIHKLRCKVKGRLSNRPQHY